jgi:hypothetical protein
VDKNNGHLCILLKRTSAAHAWRATQPEGSRRQNYFSAIETRYDHNIAALKLAVAAWSMIRKSGNRFFEKIVLKQRDEIMTDSI